MEWLHKMRAEREKERRKKGVSELDDLKQSVARGRRIMAEVRKRESPPVVRDE
jgi:hypothetical protein